MNTNFFNQIERLNITGDLQLIISKGAANNFVVSVLPQNKQCSDNAQKLIMPFTLSGTAEELDSIFFEKITAPVQAASGLMDNMEKFMKQLEEVQKQSAMEKEKSDREKKAKEEKDKKYKDAMQKVEELEKAGKFREAWMKVPEVSDYPEKADEIRKRKSELSGRFAPDLFDSAVQRGKPELPKEGLYPEYPSDEAAEEMELSNEEENEY